jgi:hypothetical protein
MTIAHAPTHRREPPTAAATLPHRAKSNICPDYACLSRLQHTGTYHHTSSLHSPARKYGLSASPFPPTLKTNASQTALFNFSSLLLVILLTICTSTYAHYVFPGIMDRNKDTYFVSPFWKAARVGERLSPYVAVACVVMAVRR